MLHKQTKAAHLLSHCPGHQSHTSRTPEAALHHQHTALPRPPPYPGPAAAWPSPAGRSKKLHCLLWVKKKKKKVSKKKGRSQQSRNKPQFCLPCSVTKGGFSTCWQKQNCSCTPSDLPNSSTGCHLSLVLHRDPHSTVPAARKFLSLDNTPGKGGRDGWTEGRRESKTHFHLCPW